MSRPERPGRAPEAPADAARIGAALAEQAAREMAEPLAGGLHVVATPIGNLGDMTVRAVTTLARAHAILCEDTRVSRTLLVRYAIERPLRAFHEHNEDAEQARILAELAEGHAIALISDAGTPLLSDPGYKLVRAAIAAGHPVTALPGASAILAGLAISGLPTDGFYFGGFLPPKQAARRTRLEILATIPASLVLFESPSRIADTLADVAAVLGEREVVVARELTKRFEEVRRGLAP
ncbi:MAG: 16S rRNA (cytidine(1402)-2'-O)-methyltransferase, partial [Hyphomicrobium sp.]|nr:16S rRNA (cytidine(1402)-2'-O)-methyltransferase [Hyphomicrobium sp.]